MYRLILITALLILLYYLIRRAVRGLQGAGDGKSLKAGTMVQDPVCRKFVLRTSAVEKKLGGQTYLFCSQDCAQTFKQQLSNQQPE